MRRIWILNLALLAVLVATIVRLHNEWIMFSATHNPGAIAPDREAFQKLPVGVPPNSPAPGNWTDIPSRNPFSFDRTDVAILEPKAPAAPPVTVGPKPALFGTMSIGKEIIALVAPGKPGNRQYKPMKAGEVVDGWTIVSISDKSIIIRANSIEESVVMNDPTAQVQRDYTRTTVTPQPAVTGAATPPPAAAPLQQPAAAQATPQPANPQQGTPRKKTILTPFGPREIDID